MNIYEAAFLFAVVHANAWITAYDAARAGLLPVYWDSVPILKRVFGCWLMLPAPFVDRVVIACIVAVTLDLCAVVLWIAFRT